MKTLFFFILFAISTLVFGQEIPMNWKDRSPQLLAPVILDNTQYVNFWISTENKEVYIDQINLFDFLRVVLKKEKYIELLELKSLNNFISGDVLQSVGIKVIFDSNELILYLKIPLEFRKKFDVSIFKQREQSGFVIEPDKFSYFINFEFNKNFINNAKNSEQLYNEYSFNFNKHIIESGHFYNSSVDNKYIRDYTRYIYDFERLTTRLTVGDLNFKTVGLQEYTQGAGISIQNDFSIDPQTLRTNYNQYEVNLSSPSKVEVFLNDEKIYQANHPRGVLNLKKLPLLVGLNEIMVHITHQSGKREVIRFDSNYHHTILPYKKSDYSLNLFKESYSDEQNKLKYQNNNQYSGFFRYGLFGQTTIGINTQGVKKNNLSGVDLSQAFGTIILNSGFNQSKTENSTSLSYDVNLETITSKKYNFLRLRSQYRFFDKGFKSITNTTNSIKTLKSLNASFALINNLNLGIGTEEVDYYNNTQSKILDLELITRFNSNSTISLRSRVDVKDSNNNNLFISFNWFENTHRFSGHHSFEDKSQTSRNQVNYNQTFNAKKLYLSSSYSNSAKNKNYNASLYSSLDTNNGLIRIDQVSTKQSKSNNLNLRFALVGNSRNLELSRYINESFLVLSSNSKSSIYINNNIGLPINNDTSTVLGNITSYRDNQIKLDLNGLEFGENLEYDSLSFKPSYNSGAFFKIKTDKEASLKFILIAENSSSIKYKEVTLVGAHSTYSTISGKKGLIFIQNIKPDTYKLYLENNYIKDIEIQKQHGLIDKGEVNVNL